VTTRTPLFVEAGWPIIADFSEFKNQNLMRISGRADRIEITREIRSRAQREFERASFCRGSTGDLKAAPDLPARQRDLRKPCA
jgi:hypothetical protein